MTRQHDSGKDDEIRQAHDADATETDVPNVSGNNDGAGHNEPQAERAAEEEALSASDTVQDAEEAPTRDRRRIMPWAVGTGILAVLLFGTLGWSYHHQQDNQLRLDRLEGELTALHQSTLSQSAVDQAVLPLGERLQALTDSVEALQKHLEEHRSVDGRYIEIDYQLRMALQRLGLNSDVRGTLELLEGVDQRLAELNEPAFIPVRAAVQDALARLGNVTSPDVDGLYLQLAAESRAVDGLKTVQDLSIMAPEHEAASIDGRAEQSWWRHELARVGNGLKDLVVVRYNSQNIDELLMPEQEGAIREHIRLGFSEAQAGLLRQSPDIYVHALHDVADTIRRYFPQDNEGVRQLLARLDTLTHQSVRPELPDVNGVLQQWLQALERQHAQQGV